MVSSVSLEGKFMLGMEQRCEIGGPSQDLAKVGAWSMYPLAPGTQESEGAKAL